MKKIAFMMVMIVGCNIYGMDTPQADKGNAVVAKSMYQNWERHCRPVDPEVAQRHNVSAFHKNLHRAVLFNKGDKVLSLVKIAGRDATELVSTQWSEHGTILEATFIYSRPEMRVLLRPYMDDDMLKRCFERNKRYLVDEMWASQSYKQGLMSNLAVVSVVRYLNLEDPFAFSLTPDEGEELNKGVKK